MGRFGALLTFLEISRCLVLRLCEPEGCERRVEPLFNGAVKNDELTSSKISAFAVRTVRRSELAQRARTMANERKELGRKMLGVRCRAS